MQNKAILAHFTLFFVNLLYAGNYIIAPFAIQRYGAFGVVAIRVFISMVCLWLIQVLFIKEKIKTKSDYFKLALCALFGISINMLCFFKGLSLTTAINASLLMIITPIFVLIVASILIKERITTLKVLGMGFGATGAFLLLAGKNFSFSQDTLMGDLLIIVNAMSYATYLVLIKPLMSKYNPFTIMLWIFTFGSIINIPFGLHDLSQTKTLMFEPAAFYGLLYVVLFVTLIAYSLNSWCVLHLNSSVVGSYIYFQPVLATLLSVYFGLDQLTETKIISGVLILMGVFLVSFNWKKKIPLAPLTNENR